MEELQNKFIITYINQGDMAAIDILKENKNQIKDLYNYMLKNNLCTKSIANYFEKEYRITEIV